MVRTDFSSKMHGFAFANTWKLQEGERQHIHEQFIAYFVGRRFLGLLGVLLAPPIIRLLRRWLIRHLSPVYGLCGGMCFAALDFYLHGYDLSPFRGQSPDDHPAHGTDLRRYIWDRQLDSLVSDGARFLIWLVLLSYVPTVWPFRGGTRWLLTQSRREWIKLKTYLDAGKPVPIGLTRATRNVFENHQVLAVGYKETDNVHGTIFVYDPNCPDTESSIHLEFGLQALNGRESCRTEAPLRGFFCETYSPSDPSEVIVAGASDLAQVSGCSRTAD